MARPVLWANGRLVADDEPVVRASDHGLTVGDGVFETCKVSRGVPFALTQHLHRLERSAAGLGLDPPPTAAARDGVAAVLAALPAGEHDLARLRVTWTAGPGPLGSERRPGAGTLLVAAVAAAPWPADPKVVSVSWTRNEGSAVAGLKTTSYAENVVALAAARERGAGEALLANTRGELCEGTGSNVVVVLDGEAVTPPLTSGCLPGITRALLLAWAREEGVPLREAVVPFEALRRCEDVLLASSTRDVQPQAAVDGRALGRGEVAAALADLYARRAGLDPDPS